MRDLRFAERVRRIGKRSPLGAISALVFTAACFALIHVWVRMQVVQLGYDISRESQLRHALEEMSQNLSLELRARTELGIINQGAGAMNLAPPDPRLIRVIKSLPATATATTGANK